jgi:hypothetical protein
MSIYEDKHYVGYVMHPPPNVTKQCTLIDMFFDKVLGSNIPYWYVLTYHYYKPMLAHWTRPILQYNIGENLNPITVYC